MSTRRTFDVIVQDPITPTGKRRLALVIDGEHVALELHAGDRVTSGDLSDFRADIRAALNDEGDGHR